MNSSSTFHANGKLLLSGEYLVLLGAKALALPLTSGQHLKVQEKASSELLHWKAFHKGDLWFECTLNPLDFEVIATTDSEKALTLSQIFKTIRLLNPAFYLKAGICFETTLDAHPQWGFGSSSTLISLLSQWAGVHPFRLNEIIFNGSGFDIACATANGPILYQKNEPVIEVDLAYPFAEQLLFIYSGNKQKTLPQVSLFLQNNKVSKSLIQEISSLTDEFVACHDQNTFNRLIRQHEALIGNLIGQIPVKERLFHDFKGEVKSLGAWGGDYYLISSHLSYIKIKKYFENKGLNIIFRWTELIKN